ncbi:MAG: DUF21 domain-containing protein [Proteobacteria bacterium]|nr:DUF21 domain-containing protein [Pseudomonadota bacterium]HQR05119.1 CNNM domain-containing protein [Rhodocyclaceae bacterium]
MDDLSLSTELGILALLLALSGFFSAAETAMMASNRYRLRTLAQNGHRGARLALQLLAQTDRLLSTILLGNTLVNAASATLAGLITVELFGEAEWILGAGTLAVSMLILVFSEITPKVVAANHADRMSLVFSYLLIPIMMVTSPVISFVNIFVSGLLRITGLHRSGEDSHALSSDELRTVLESAHSIPAQHRTILGNLFDLEHITVVDAMIPRRNIEAVDLHAPLEDIRQQLATGYHTRIPVYEDDPGNVIGILHQRRLLVQSLKGEWDRETLRELLVEPYYIPAGTRIYAQLQFFKENRQRMGLVVDEYGEILGLLTLEDIIEEIVGQFTTGMPGNTQRLSWDASGTALVEGGCSLRELNRDLGLDLPLEGPKTLNGLILEHFEDIPESGVSTRIGDVTMEIVQTQDRSVRMVRLYRPAPSSRADDDG